MTMIEVPCPTCAATGESTHEDRHAGPGARQPVSAAGAPETTLPGGEAERLRKKAAAANDKLQSLYFNSGHGSVARLTALAGIEAITALLAVVRSSGGGEKKGASSGPDCRPSDQAPSGLAAFGASIPRAEDCRGVEEILRDAWHDIRDGEPQNDPDAGLTHEQIAAEIDALARDGTRIGGTVLGALNRAYRRGLERPR